MPQQPDWFASNAPKSAGGDWFAENRRSSVAPSAATMGPSTAKERLSADVIGAQRDPVAAMKGQQQPNAVMGPGEAPLMGGGLAFKALAMAYPEAAATTARLLGYGSGIKLAQKAGAPPWLLETMGLGVGAREALRGRGLAAGAPDPYVIENGRLAPRLDVGPTAQPIGPQPSPNFGGRLVKGSALSDEQALADALAELRQPSKPNAVTLPTAAQLPSGYTPRTSGLRVTGRIIVPSPSGAAAVEAASLDPRISNLDQPPPARPTFKSPPDAYTRVLQRESAIPRLEDLKATTASPTSADTPRDWHSGATDSPLAQRMQAAHKVIMDEDARYRAATAGERAMFQAMPKTYKDALLASLLTPK